MSKKRENNWQKIVNIDLEIHHEVNSDEWERYEAVLPIISLALLREQIGLYGGRETCLGIPDEGYIQSNYWYVLETRVEIAKKELERIISNFELREFTRLKIGKPAESDTDFEADIKKETSLKWNFVILDKDIRHLSKKEIKKKNLEFSPPFEIKLLGSVTVDSGLIICVDPCNIVNFEEILEKIKKKNVYQLQNSGIVIGTQIGDGVFPVMGLFCKKRLKGISIILEDIDVLKNTGLNGIIEQLNNWFNEFYNIIKDIPALQGCNR